MQSVDADSQPQVIIHTNSYRMEPEPEEKYELFKQITK